MRRPEHVYLLEPNLFPGRDFKIAESSKTSRDGLFFSDSRVALRPDGQGKCIGGSGNSSNVIVEIQCPM